MKLFCFRSIISEFFLRFSTKIKFSHCNDFYVKLPPWVWPDVTRTYWRDFGDASSWFSYFRQWLILSGHCKSLWSLWSLFCLKLVTQSCFEGTAKKMSQLDADSCRFFGGERERVQFWVNCNFIIYQKWPHSEESTPVRLKSPLIN